MANVIAVLAGLAVFGLLWMCGPVISCGLFIVIMLGLLLRKPTPSDRYTPRSMWCLLGVALVVAALGGFLGPVLLMVAVVFGLPLLVRDHKAHRHPADPAPPPEP